MYALILAYFLNGQLYMTWGADFPTMEECNAAGYRQLEVWVEAGLPVSSTGFVCSVSEAK